MALTYSKSFNRRHTRQTEPIPGSTQVRNSAGGYSWATDDWSRLDRFLILGAEGGTYYQGARDLLQENHEALNRCLRADGMRTVKRIIEISDSGRAPKNDPAIFALAMATAHGDAPARALAYGSVGQVCRTGTHLFHFAAYASALRGWGRGLRRALGRWYAERQVDDLAYQLIKYQQRDGWSYGDLLRLAHPKAPGPGHDALFRWIRCGAGGLAERSMKRRSSGRKSSLSDHPTNECSRRAGSEPRPGALVGTTSESSALAESSVSYPTVPDLPPLIAAFEHARKAVDKLEIIRLINAHNLPREAIPTRWLNEVSVWDALLARMPLTALLRNLGKMTSLGLIAPFSTAARRVVDRLQNREALRRSRLHPLAVLMAAKVYSQGHGELGKLSWNPVATVTAALDDAFYAAFDNVEPCGKPVLLALDVSGSMEYSYLAGSLLTAREASAAMALVTAATEPDYCILAFAETIRPLDITSRMRLPDVIRRISNLPFSGTDCALPMLWARRERLAVSGFITYTDSETWAGEIHPTQALRQYRQEQVPDAKAIVVGMESNGFTVADPDDPGMLDVVGFDTATPALIADFLRGGQGLSSI